MRFCCVVATRKGAKEFWKEQYRLPPEAWDRALRHAQHINDQPGGVATAECRQEPSKATVWAYVEEAATVKHLPVRQL